MNTTSSIQPEHFAPMTEKETKEVRRAFELLSDYHEKSNIRREVSGLKSWMTVNRNRAFPGPDDPVAITQNRMDELNSKLDELESVPYNELKRRKISAADVMEMLGEIGHKASKKEVEEMIWEVDENLDNCLDWAEFKLMYNRNITDKIGLEPSRMFNLVQFLIYDTNRNGLVSVDETMHLLYARYGRVVMEQKLKELFGEDMQEFGTGGGEITFAQFIAAVERVQLNKFLETNQGKRAKDLQRVAQSKSR